MLAVFDVLLLILNIVWWLVVASVVLSWLYAFNIVNSGNRFVDSVGTFLYRMTEPLFRPIRSVLPYMGGIDLSPLVVLVAIFFLQQLILRYGYAAAYGAGI